MKLEQHYQCELKAFSESHVEQKVHWEEQIQKALENTEEQRRTMEEAMEQEREWQKEEWTKEQYKLENIHKEEMEELMIKKRRLQNELDDFIIKAQTKEIELSRQLNDLHNRLQENLETKDELLAQSELLLNQTIKDFSAERAELLSGHLELEAKYNELLLISEKQVTEGIGLLTERDDLKMKIDELEMLLRQAAVDFELERNELQEHESILKKSQDNLETEREELITERNLLRRRIKELEMEQNQSLTSNELDTAEVQNTRACISFSGKEQKTCSASEICLNNLVILAESSNKEQVRFSPFLIELDSEVETVTETPDTVSGSPKNIINPHQEHGEKSPATIYDQTYDMLEIQTDDGENQDQENQTVPTENSDTCPDIGERCKSLNFPITDSSPKEAELDCDVGCSTETDLYNKKESVCSLLEVFEGVDTKIDESCEEENKPQDVPAVAAKSPSLEDEQYHVTVVDPSQLEETGDPSERSVEDGEVYRLPNHSHSHEQEVEFLSDSNCAQLCLEHLDEGDDDREDLLKLQALYNTATEENILLHQKIALLQQKSEILENLLAHNSEKLKTGNQVLEENYTLKVKMLLLMEHVKEQEAKALKMTDLQIRYEDCICENAKLKDQNGELEKRVWCLESERNSFHDFQDQQFSLVDEISSLREENDKLLEMFTDLEEQHEILSGMEQLGDDLLGLTIQTDINFQPERELEGCCVEFEKQNVKLRRAITELKDKSQTLSEATQSHR